MLCLLTAVLLGGLQGCSSGPAVLKISDIMQVRPILSDDPLAARFLDVEGREVRTGDAVLSDSRIWTATVQTGTDGNFDLMIRLRDAEASKWRTFARRNNRKDAALLIDGRVRIVFQVERIPDEDENTKIFIRNVAATQEDADALSRRLDAMKPAAAPNDAQAK